MSTYNFDYSTKAFGLIWLVIHLILWTRQVVSFTHHSNSRGGGLKWNCNPYA